MKNIILYISTLLTWVAFDPSSHRRRRALKHESEISFVEELEELEQEKKIKRHRLDVVPHRFRIREIKLRSKCNYQGTKSKDVRDSNQRMIRRKFSNM